MTTTESQKYHDLVAKDFKTISGDDATRVLVVDLTGDALWEAYLAAFPEGTNPIFNKKTEHDCSTCRNFVRHAGNVVYIGAGGEVSTVWDSAAEKAPHPYNVVARAMRERVLAAPLRDLFRVSLKENQFGSKVTRSQDGETGSVLTWHHLYTGPIPATLQSATPDKARGDHRTTVQVFERGLRDLSASAVATVLDLIDANALYRGAEFRPALLAFQQAQTKYAALTGRARECFLWTEAYGPASRFRNTAMGTLVVDLTSGTDLEAAVKAFEKMVAPTNYKRPTALITPAMVSKAMETIAELGLESALERRFARFSDITTNDVLWVDNATREKLKGGLGTLTEKLLAATAPPVVDPNKAEPIDIEKFISEVLPTATGVELMFAGKHAGNLVTLTAPIHPEPKQLFKWKNDFAWAYAGGITDSIAERVKKAGGKVDGAALRVSLSWYNTDDLDLHILEPPVNPGRSRGLIYFGAKRGETGGELDVDMNVRNPIKGAVENVVWMRTPRDGVYNVIVNNFTQRETSEVGFTIEVECGGKLSHFAFNKGVRNKENIQVVQLTMKGGKLVEMQALDPGVSTSVVSQTKWGIDTEHFHKVTCVTRSPNYWGDNATGNKHTIFVLENCAADEPVRGVFNEFLHPRLDQHRKVFEVIGEKTKCPPVPAAQQLSGLGFSSTKLDSVLMKVQQGRKQRIFNVNICYTI